MHFLDYTVLICKHNLFRSVTCVNFCERASNESITVQLLLICKGRIMQYPHRTFLSAQKRLHLRLKMYAKHLSGLHDPK